MLHLLLLIALTHYGVAAPVEKVKVAEGEHEISLIRVKRTAEESFIPRVKKSGPLSPLAPQEDELVDKNASVDIETPPAEDEAKPSPDVADDVTSDTSSEEDDNNGGKALEEDKTIEEEDNSVSSNEEESPLQDLLGDGKEESLLPILSKEEPIGENNGADKDYLDYWNALLNRYDLYDTYRRKRSLSMKGRPQRSISTAVKAEDMSMSSVQKSVREKRSLGVPEDLRGYLEGDYDYLEPEYDYPQLEEQSTPGGYKDWLEEDLEQYLLENALANKYAQKRSGPPAAETYDYLEPYYDSEEPTYDSDQDELEEVRDRLAMLRLLYGNEGEDNADDTVPYGEDPGYYNAPKEENESWEDLGPADDVEYQNIVYDGQPGIFIPVKRQLSFVPGNRKRNFYPFNYGPDGRWGALVPNEEEKAMEKRNEAQMYERLYRLAAALRERDEQAQPLDELWRRK